MRKSSFGLALRILLAGLASLGAPAALASPIITEFCATHRTGLVDEDGDFSDWIEIYNPDSLPQSLEGFRLTDKPDDNKGWTFPALTLDPGAYLVVFASGKDRRDASQPLHTDFQLAAEGEFLALLPPVGDATTSPWSLRYPSQTEDQSFGLDPQGFPLVWSFFTTPTPGAVNAPGKRAGPVVVPEDTNPPAPAAGPVTLRVSTYALNAHVTGVVAYYRRMFVAEARVVLTDNGAGADAVAGDGVWSASLPASAFVPGEMTRWRFVATDASGLETENPPYPNPLDSSRYYGTVTEDARIQSKLPVLHWFVSNAASAGTASGARGSLYYDGEFYDNVLFTLHGQSSAGFPKKSYNIDFNRDHRFRWSTNAPRVADIDLLTNWADKSKARHVLAYEVMRQAGVAAHFAYTVRVQQNGRFFSTADFVEDADERYLERAGLNPQGALYKVYANLLNKDAGNTGNSGVEKKTRVTENNQDLQALIDGLDLTGTALERYLFDNIDLAACVNFLAANSVIRNIDMHQKNWYAYRDTGRSGEWSILPWDLDLSFGRVWNEQNTYFDNALYTDGFVVTADSIRLVSHLFNNPRTRAMIFRRIRTLTDQFLQPPPAAGTPESALHFETRLNEVSTLMDPAEIRPSDAQLDFEKWGSWLQGGAVVSYTNASPAVESMAEGIQRFKTEYLPARRRYIYQTQIAGRGGEIPLPQNQIPAVTNFTVLLRQGAPAKARVPANATLGLTWTGDPAREPFNTAGWLSGTTGVGYERASGYQDLIGLDVNAAMSANNSVYIRVEFNVTDPAAFNRLELRMKYDDGFVAYLNGTLVASANAPASPQWNSAALASREANPNAFTAFDVSDRLSLLRPGRNVLAIQGLNDALTSSDMIIVPELHAGTFTPASSQEPQLRFGAIEFRPVSGNQDEEFIQIQNPNPIAIDISGWQITGGVQHVFAGGTVLPPNGTLYLSPNVAAFRARRISPKGGEGLQVQGAYQGHLSNAGETLVLMDSTGSTNHVASYEGQPSDAQRFLVISEVHYHPANLAGSEFVELLNTSDSVTIDLRGVRFTDGVLFDFTHAAITNLAPGGRVLVVRDLAEFAATYGVQRPVAGRFTNDTALANGGEHLKLEDAENGTIAEFTYDDDPPWPTEPSVSGYSLVLIRPTQHPDPALASNWRRSVGVGGNPGVSDTLPLPPDPNADTNGNGDPDLIDYAIGNDGFRPRAFLQLELIDPSDPERSPLRLSYPVGVGADLAEITVVYSTDLATWQEAAPWLTRLGTFPLDSSRVWATWQFHPPTGSSSPLFLRLKAVSR
ncbi:MAG: lamin tail domain-containing protein [Verrucomicrobiales bacterium]|nr:lamin tail domain-containing protein [Verrucomicrobiales bacterium]